MKKRCEEIVIDSYAVGTTDVMKYADEHPNEYFDHTNVRSSKTDYGQLMVSEHTLDESTKECLDLGIYKWHQCPNGWLRLNVCGWICKKGERVIFITT